MRAIIKRPTEPVPYAELPPEEPDESLRRYAMAGWIIVGIFFGVFGLWAIAAPLNGAVVANAVIKVDGNRKSVQHLEGGIVKDVKVKEGDRVKAGDVVLVLDDSQARADFEVFSRQQMVLRATEARLLAELSRASALDPPPDIAARLNEPDMKDIWSAQQKQFHSRRADIDGQRKIIAEKINQLKEQISGGESQVVSYGEQLDSVRKELDNITPLVDRGLIAQPRRFQLERGASGLQGQIAEAGADVARAKLAIAEQTQQIAQLDYDRATEITKDLRDTQSLLLEVTPKLDNAKATLGRLEVRSPYSGTVVGLNVFAVGAVIQRGERILDIVPDDDDLTVEAQIAVEDISDVHPGMKAEINLTAYKARITPMVHGDVVQVSADRLSDQRTGVPYYTALIRADRRELAQIPNVQLYPGMPARVLVPTIERTAFDYLVGPLAASFNTAFRQR